MRVRTKPVEMEAWAIKSLCAWYQRRQAQGMPEPIKKALVGRQIDFLGDCLRLKTIDGTKLGDWDDVLLHRGGNRFEVLSRSLFEQRFDLVDE